MNRASINNILLQHLQVDIPPRPILKQWKLLKFNSKVILMSALFVIVLCFVDFATTRILAAFIAGFFGVIAGALGIGAFRTIHGHKNLMIAHFVLCLISIMAAISSDAKAGAALVYGTVRGGPPYDDTYWNPSSPPASNGTAPGSYNRSIFVYRPVYNQKGDAVLFMLALLIFIFGTLLGKCFGPWLYLATRSRPFFYSSLLPRIGSVGVL